MRIVIFTGVAGSGKTTVGKRLADRLGWDFYEADDFHCAAAKAKMAAGTPLDDGDRAPWLAAIRAGMEACVAQGRSAVFTCSALKERYRRVLLEGMPAARLVYLSGDYDTIAGRVRGRTGHYMKENMVRSQFDALEPPSDALSINVNQDPDGIVDAVCSRLGL